MEPSLGAIPFRLRATPSQPDKVVQRHLLAILWSIAYQLFENVSLVSRRAKAGCCFPSLGVECATCGQGLDERSLFNPQRSAESRKVVRVPNGHSYLGRAVGRLDLDVGAFGVCT